MRRKRRSHGLCEAGYGEFFVHRTGHGVDVETHQEPYIVAGNDTPLEPGTAFSVEPGIYLPGRHDTGIETPSSSPRTGASRSNVWLHQFTVR